MAEAQQEDRPKVPLGIVVFENAPRDMKRVFRFWDDNFIHTEVLGKGGLQRSGSLKAIPMKAVLEAVRSQSGKG